MLTIMKLRMNCMKCFEVDGKPSQEFIYVEPEDNGLYQITCSKNHTSVICLQNQQFEILFELGCIALMNGYPREAVLTFISCWERFHEFCIKVFLNKTNISYELFENTWKLVTNQSERQLGAFYLLYLHELKTTPPTFIDDQASFRNKVTHKGHIPKSTKAWEYAEKVFDYIKSIMFLLQNEYKEQIDTAIKNHLRLLQIQAKKQKVSTMAWRSIFNVMGTDLETRSFQEELDEFKSSRINTLYSHT